ncbi:hypothetical protein GQ42DRAFT_163865 [Ramicandelaber brevisporus]|nr:hypothetical protein GQ42DRAFT_163865 [Ramicandelaber brevisporus]
MNTKLGEATNVAMARSFELAQAGWFAQIGGTLTFVTAPLYVFIADNVAQYHIAGVVSHSSTFNCGHCNVSKDKLNINDLMDDTMPRTRDHQQRAVEAVEKLQNIIDVGQLKPGFRAECKYYNAQELEKMRRRLGGGALDLENVVVRIPIVNCKNKKRGRPAKKSVSHAAASTTSATADRATSSTAASSTISGRAAARVTSTAQPANAIEDDEEEEEEDDADLDSVGEVPAYIREIADEEGDDEDGFDDDDAQTDTGVTQRHSVQSHSSSKLITHDGGDGGRYAGRGATVMNMFLDLLPELRQLFRDFGMSMDDLLHDLRVYGKREMLTYTGVCKLVKFMEANLTGPNTIFANSFSTMPFLGLALDLLHDVHLGMSNVLIKAFNKVNSTGKYHNISMKQAIDELNAEGPKSVREKCGYTKIPQPSGDCLTGKHCATLMLALPFILGKMGRKKYTRLLTIEMRFAMVYRDLILLLGRKRNGTLVNYRNSVEHQLRMVYMELRALAEQKPYTDLIGVTIKTHRLFKHLPELIGKYGGTTYMSSEIFEAGNAAARQARQRFTQSSGDAFSLVRLTRTFLFQLNDVVQHASRIYANAHGQPQPEEQTTGTASSRAPTPTPTPTTTAALANVTNRNDANVDTTVRLEADNLQSQRRITQLESERDAANARADALQTQLEELQRQLLAERAQR